MASELKMPKLRLAQKLSLVPIFSVFLSACFTAEFHPSAQYETLPHANPDSIQVSFLPPEGSYAFLGDLVFADISDPHDSGFLDYVKIQANRRGASYAYVDLTRTHVERGVDYVPGPIPYFAGNMPVKTTYKTIFVALYVHETSK